MKAYWSGNGIDVYHAKWEDVIAAGVVDVRSIALIHSDPPYGVSERTDRASKGRGFSRTRPGVASRDFPSIEGDDRPFEPAALIAMNRPLVLWGANHYSDKVPGSPSWILWDKREQTTPNDNADGELAWSNLGGPLRIFRHLWNGLCRASEAGEKVLAPSQKPIELSRYVFGRAKLKPGALVFVSHLGSGPDLPAARAMGLRVLACDVEQWCCDTAIARLPDAPLPIVARAQAFQRRAAVLTPERAAEPVGPLFGAPVK